MLLESAQRRKNRRQTNIRETKSQYNVADKKIDRHLIDISRTNFLLIIGKKMKKEKSVQKTQSLRTNEMNPYGLKGISSIEATIEERKGVEIYVD